MHEELKPGVRHLPGTAVANPEATIGWLISSISANEAAIVESLPAGDLISTAESAAPASPSEDVLFGAGERLLLDGNSVTADTQGEEARDEFFATLGDATDEMEILPGLRRLVS
jgi:hypothetical protein